MLGMRLVILLVFAYLVFIVINVLFSSGRTTLFKRNRNPLDEPEELVLVSGVKATSLRLKPFPLTAIISAEKSVPGFL
jgi:hypothetical protein